MFDENGKIGPEASIVAILLLALLFPQEAIPIPGVLLILALILGTVSKMVE